MLGNATQPLGQVSPQPRRRILVVCFDPIGPSMPGPAIRAWNLALQLAARHDVVLAGTAGVDRDSDVMAVEAADGPRLAELALGCDAVFAPTSVMRRHPELAATGRPLCIDMYIPTHLENLEALDSPGSEAHRDAVAHQVSVIDEDLRRGDFFLCASERQRDFWLGSLAAVGRVNPANFLADPTLRSLIDVVPFGLDPADPPEGGALRDAFPAIGPDDPVVLWGGGVYNWFDPLPVLAAVAGLRRNRPGIRLVFMGMRNPNPGIPEMRVAADLRSESDRLGLTGETVFFNEGWVAYDRRGSWLADASVAVSTHLEHLETRFSFRTRVLDYLWAGVPMVLTGGDTLSEEVAAAGLGILVGPGDTDGVAAAIDRLLDAPPDRAAIRSFGRRWSWAAVAEPLAAWADSPGPAPDRGESQAAAGTDLAGQGPPGVSEPASAPLRPAWQVAVAARLPEAALPVLRRGRRSVAALKGRVAPVAGRFSRRR